MASDTVRSNVCIPISEKACISHMAKRKKKRKKERNYRISAFAVSHFIIDLVWSSTFLAAGDVVVRCNVAHRWVSKHAYNTWHNAKDNRISLFRPIIRVEGEKVLEFEDEGILGVNAFGAS